MKNLRSILQKLPRLKLYLTIAILACVFVASNAMASGRLVGHIEVVVIAGRFLMIEGFVMDSNSKRMDNGFISGILSKDDKVVYLPRKEVSGRFSEEYNLEKYRGWNYSVTLYGHEDDGEGMSRELMTKSGVLSQKE